MTPIVVHRVDRNNIGDMSSNPMQYYDTKHSVIDIIDIPQTVVPDNVPIIFGGGGLVGNEFIGDAIRTVLRHGDLNQLLALPQRAWKATDPSNRDLQIDFQKKINDIVQEYIHKLKTNKLAPRIAWGVGHNGPPEKGKDIEYPDYMDLFNLVGVRDFNQRFEYVPCASCKDPAFRKTYTVKNDIIVFEHKKQLLKGNEFGDFSIPRFVNSGQNMEQTIELLGGANTVLTNSYHGAYWSLLLGKRTIVIDSWSTKFRHLGVKPIYLKKQNMQELMTIIETTKPQTNTFLEDSIQRNDKFWREVKGML